MLTQIKASAGSGKTYALTRHFLALLANAQSGAPVACGVLPADSVPGNELPYDLGGILAATFTNKAAAEMKARVMRDLKAAALGLEDDIPFSPDEAARWVESILRSYDALNIRTIDSLLALLVRAGALSLELPPDFAPVFDDSEYFAPLYDALLDRLSAGDIETREAVREACRGLIFHGEAKGFLAGDKVRDKLLEVVKFSLARGEDAPRLAMNEEEITAINAYVTELRERVIRATRRVKTLLEAEALKGDSRFLTMLDGCLECAPKPPSKLPTWLGKSSLDECLAAASRGRASDAAYSAFMELVEAYQMFMAETPPLRTALELAPFARLAEPLAETLARLLREEGRVPAALMPGLARHILEGKDAVTDAFCRLGNRLAHLLFDEFQDTSREQWSSMLPLAEECLSKGGSLTYVGDVKQAIYGWRGGDAALFDEVPEETRLRRMLRTKPEPVTLKENWRSAPAVVTFNNSVFCALDSAIKAQAVLEALMPSETPLEVLKEGAHGLAGTFAGARQAIPAKRAAAMKDTPGFIRLTQVEAANKDEVKEAVRERLIPLLRDELLPVRPYGDIAVLVRRNEEASDVAAWLTEEGIPVVTEHSFLLASHPLILRLKAFLTFLEFPADETAFWDFIAGPEVFLPAAGIDADALFAWLAAVRAKPEGRGKDGGAGRQTKQKPGGPKGGAALSPYAPLYRLFARDFPEAWDRWIAPFHDRAGLMSAYDTLREVIRRFRVLETLPDHAPFVRRFLEVADAAERQGHSSLSAFLEFWDDSGNKEKVPMPEGMDAVRILTMHKAKGLEFPVVIVPFHHGGGKPNTSLTHARVGKFTVLTRLTKHLGEPYYRQAMKDALEQINLLYVAWTRPTEELHAFLSASKSARSQPGLARAVPVLLEDFTFDGDVCVTAESDKPGQAKSRKKPRAQKVAAPLPDNTPEAPAIGALPQQDAPFIPMDWLPRLKIFRNPVGETVFTERKRGLLAHACLELLRPSGDVEADALRAYEQAMRSFPLPIPDEEAVKREMLGMLHWFLALPDGWRWLRDGRAEQSLLDTDGHVYRMDLLVDEGEAGLLTVEYKTGRPNPAHEEQVLRYVRLLSRATGRKTRGVLVYLDLHELREVNQNGATAADSGEGI